MADLLQVAAKALIFNDKGRVLIVREPKNKNPGSQDGLYGLVGGRLNQNENYEQGLNREALEEAGLKIEILFPIYIGEWYPVIKDRRHHIVAIFSVCKAVTSNVRLSTEHDDFKWISPKKIKDYEFMFPDDKVIQRYSHWLDHNYPYDL